MNRNPNIEKELNTQNYAGLHWFHWAIIIGSLLLTLFVWHFSNQQVQEKAKIRFNQQSNHVVELLIERLRKYEDALWAGVATIHSQASGIDSQKWARFASTLRLEEKYPGINGIGVIYKVLPEDLPEFLKNERKLQPEFKNHPPHQETEFWPITYIEPLATNLKALGLDMAHETNRFTAAKKSRDTGETQITAPIVLVQDSAKTPGFLFFAPFYKRGEPVETAEQRQEAFIGLVSAPFIMNKLLDGTLHENVSNVSVKISDGESVLYNENVLDEDGFDEKPLYSTVKEIEIYGRPWRFELQSTLAFRMAAQDSQPMLILLAGILIDSLLLVLFIILSKSNKRANRLALELSKQYKEQASEAKEATSFLDLIMQNVPNALFVKDEKFTIIQANEEFLAFYPEEQRDSVIGASSIEGYAPEEREEFISDDKKAFAEGYVSVIETIQFPDGRTRKLHTQKTRFENSQGEAFILGVAQDVTEREELIEKLQLSNEELERFAYVASHDLKAPLRAIDNLSQWIEEDIGDNIDADSRENMKLMRQRVKRMENLLDDLLEYSRITRKIEEASPETVVGKELLENIVTLVAPPKDMKIIASEAFKEIEIQRMPVQQVLYNLVNNAVKHCGDDKGTVKLDVKDKGKFLEFTVADNGQGIAEEFHSKVFDMFQTLQSRDKIEGSGMGLALVSKIVTTIGGETYLESAEGKGATFAFTWPK